MDVARLLLDLGIQTRRQGGELWAICPLPSHPDRAPSWSIVNDPTSLKHGHWYCRGCMAGGGPVALVARVTEVSTADARAWLDARGFREVPAEPPTGVEIALSGAPRPLGDVLPPGVEFGPLDRWPSPIRQYLATRGIGAEQAARWRLGYAVDGLLAGRVVLPIEDRSGRLCSYTARTYDGRQPRYYACPNPRDASVPFGARHWPVPSEKATKTVHLAEGAFNALACERAGAEFIAALGGTRTAGGDSVIRPDVAQLNQVASFGEVVLVADPDAAGDRLASAIGPLGRWIQVRRVFLPKGTDADSLTTDRLRRFLCPAG